MKLAPVDAVRIEELLNYFTYNEPRPPPATTRSRSTSRSPRCPWNPEPSPGPDRPDGQARWPGTRGRRRNLVFLIDVSGSMADASTSSRLLKASLGKMVEQLGENDQGRRSSSTLGANGRPVPPSFDPVPPHRTSILSASSTAIARPSGGDQRRRRHPARRTDLADGELHQANATNRVILATDGDFNVGVQDRGELIAT